MAYGTVFQRYELKYKITLAQKQRLLEVMRPYMAIDRYGRTTIRNLYFDTDDYRLIRRSLEKPIYKEKLRIRAYAQATADSTVFVELKKKYKHVVYKRRVPLRERQAMAWLSGNADAPSEAQIAREIDYFLHYYGNYKNYGNGGSLRPTVFLSYEREAFYMRDESDFRVTFDDHILFREDGLSLREQVGGIPLLADGWVLMELKCAGGIPLWMARALSEEGIYKTSFSKYGTAYREHILPKLLKHPIPVQCDPVGRVNALDPTRGKI